MALVHEHEAAPAVRRHYRGALLCNGHNNRGELCGAIAIKGKTKCRMCGGRSLSGASHPNYKHGRYSKVIPAQLAQHYQEFRSSPRLMSLSEEIALQQAHLADLLGQVGTGESGAAWEALQEALDAFSAALAKQDQGGMNTHYGQLRRIVGQGSTKAGLWKEIQATCETLRGLVSTETKTLLGMQQLITVQQHMLMLGAVHDVIVQAVKAHVDTKSGRKILMAVEAEFTKLATREEK